VIELIATVERDREDWQTEDKTSTGVEPKIERLRKLRGVGPIFATVLTREVFYRSFANRREVGSYVGLAPTPFNSGESRRDQGVSKAGNPRARATAIELAWLWLRHQPDSAPSQWYRQRVGTLYGRIRKITIVAVARKLVVALWRYLETGVMPTGAVLKV
jgi:transposase